MAQPERNEEVIRLRMDDSALEQQRRSQPPVRTGTTTIAIPPRRIDADTGTRFMQRIKDLMGDVHQLSARELERRRAQVEEMIYQEINHGNVPDFMRPENYRTITVERTIGGRRVQATLRICPDYFAIGRNDDYVLMPMNPRTAQRIADRFGLALPTQRIVDMVDDEARRTGGYLPFYAAPQIAGRVTNPANNRPASVGWNYAEYGFYEGRWMLSPQFTQVQTSMIDEAMGRAGNPQGFRSGHKKDVIYDPLAIPDTAKGPRVVIYHRGIQGRSDIHEVTYSDYSHGIRFLDQHVEVTITDRDGATIQQTLTMAEILRDRQLCQLISPIPMDISAMYRETAARAVPRRTAR